MLKQVLSKYIVYIVYFLGIGMVSSGIVLMPFNAVRYGAILIIGLTLFSVGSFVNDIFIEKKILSLRERISLIIVSLTLAIGIGMISGGIAHFKESPVYVSYLIPIGLVISFLSFVIKNNHALNRKEKTITASIFAVTVIVLHLGLSYGAQMLDNNKPGGDIFKGHGKEKSM